MLFPRLLRLAITLAVCVGSQLGAANRSHLDPAVEKYLQPLLQTNNFSGVVLVAKGDEIIFQRGYGYASIEHGVPNSPATVFQIASLSKPFTAAAILVLAEQRKLDIRAPLNAIPPGYATGTRCVRPR